MSVDDPIVGVRRQARDPLRSWVMLSRLSHRSGAGSGRKSEYARGLATSRRHG